MADFRVIEVHDDQLGVLVGHLTVYPSRNGESYTFEYSEQFLSHPQSYDLDTLLERNTRAVSSTDMFDAFTDCAPDRWGRKLIQRASDRRVTESDYVLLVDDELRQGALRFRENGEWLSKHGTVPKMIELQRIIALSRDIRDANDEKLHALSKALLAEGTSALGGAYPKATVRDTDGKLYLAKFAHVRGDHRGHDSVRRSVRCRGLPHRHTSPAVLRKKRRRPHAHQRPAPIRLGHGGVLPGESVTHTANGAEAGFSRSAEVFRVLLPLHPRSDHLVFEGAPCVGS